MSNQDSFIDEVTEEVRRDKLYKTFRKYGWIGALLVILIVGGAAFNEYRKAQAASEAQAAGDAILAALEISDPLERVTALAELEASGSAEKQAILALMRADSALQSDDRSTAMALFTKLADDSALPTSYRDLATMKLVLAAGSDMSADEKIGRLNSMALGGGAFRLLATEQLALAEIERGDSDAALAHLRTIIEDATVSQGLRRRASQLIVALGGELTAG